MGSQSALGLLIGEAKRKGPEPVSERRGNAKAEGEDGYRRGGTDDDDDDDDDEQRWASLGKKGQVVSRLVREVSGRLVLVRQSIRADGRRGEASHTHTRSPATDIRRPIKAAAATKLRPRHHTQPGRHRDADTHTRRTLVTHTPHAHTHTSTPAEAADAGGRQSGQPASQPAY